jgi:CRP-like cAMP-binding protein
MSLSCVSCGKRGPSLFSDLPAHLLERLDQQKSIHTYKSGQIIFYQGSPSLAVYCVCEGHVKLYKSGSDGSEALLRLLGPGDVLGYRAVLSEEPYAASAEALGDSKTCIISKETFFEMFRASPDFCAKVMAKLAVELRISEDEMVARIRDPVPRRIARMLLRLLSELGETGGEAGRMALPFPQRELALMIGTSPETLSRTLHSFVEDGVLAIEGRRVLIRDLHALEALAGENPRS